MIEISVVLPVYRNRDTLEALHGRLAATLEPHGANLEFIFVNDACPSGSAEVLVRLARLDSRVRLLTHERNLGQRLAVWHGLAAARGELIVTMDADLQDRPESIPLLLNRLRAGGVGAVFAGRRGEYQGRLRMVASRGFKALLSRLTGLPADAGTFVVLTRDARDRMLRIEAPSPHLPALLRATGVRLASVGLEREPRRSGESAYSEWTRITLAWKDLVTAWQMRRR